MLGTLEQNGVTERRNHTLMDTVRSMASQIHLLEWLWGKALKTVASITKTTFELWIGRKPSLSHFHVWGCLVEVKVYTSTKKKIHPKIINRYFVGYANKSKGYRFYCPNAHNIIVEAINAIFFKNAEISGSSYVEETREQQRIILYQ